MELMGYPLISGTNTMSTVIALLETGRIPMKDGLREVTLEAPGGPIRTLAECRDGKVMAVTYSAESPSFMAEKGRVVDVPGWGEVTFDMLWTGAFYPVVDASKLGFAMVKEDEEELVRFAKAFVPLARKVSHPAHPVFGHEGPLSFVIFAGLLDGDAGNGYQRKVCCYEYPPNSVCRSPAGVPSTAATVQLFIQGKLNVGARLQTASIFDSTLDVEIMQESEHHGHRGVRVAVTGTGWITSRSEFVVDFNDPFTPGEGFQALLM